MLRDSLHSSFSEEDLEFQKQSMIFEHEDKMDDPDQFVPEKLFETGITGPLGHPSVPSPDVVKQITLSGLLQFRDRHLRGGNVVVGGVGVELEELLPVSESLFGNLKSGADKHDFMMRYHGGDCLLTEGFFLFLALFFSCLITLKILLGALGNYPARMKVLLNMLSFVFLVIFFV